MDDVFLISTAAYLGAVAVVLAAMWLFAWHRRRRAAARLGERAGPARPGSDAQGMSGLVRGTLPHLGAVLAPESEAQRNQLQQRLAQAGLYGRQAMYAYLGVKAVLLLAPVGALGLGLGLAGVVPMKHAIGAGGLLSGAGMVAPGIWLDRRTARRQGQCRAGLPDFLDILVICLEAGLSPSDALRRVVGDLGAAHPVLGRELRIAQREMEFGLNAGEALRNFAERAGLRELHHLALAIRQTERYGGGLARTMRLQAETLRFQQYQHMEAAVQKANTKILLPTLLFIFPGVFVILLGPAAMQVAEVMAQMKTVAQKTQLKK